MSNRITAESFVRDKFYQLPKVLFTNPKYRKLKSNAKIVYAILKDRMELSIKNNHVNERGEIYFTYDEDKLSDLTGISKRSIGTARSHLEEVGLLETERTGRANIYFLTHPEVTKEAIEKTIENDQFEENKTAAERDEKGRFQKEEPRSAKIADQVNYPDEHENKPSEIPTNKDSNQISKNCKSDPQELLANDTDLIYTDDDDKLNKTHVREVSKLDQYLGLVEYYLESHNVPKNEITHVLERMEENPSLINGEAIQKQMNFMLSKLQTGIIYRFGPYFIQGLSVIVSNQKIKSDTTSVDTLQRCLKIEQEPLPKVSLNNWLENNDTNN
ncbi:replication initiator protein A [Enterococcus sp. DIV0800]|uniref:replication initiator protein A n=1 Tax=unclassified Enterococcus TaxID=2608891 RepID=UPI003D2FA37E